MRTLLAPAWLILRNDLRLRWRELRGHRLALAVSTAALGFLFVLLNLFSWLLFVAGHRSSSLLAETIVWLFLALVMFNTAMNHAIRVLFENPDFDLLLPAPVSPRAILFARWAAMTLGAMLNVAFFAVPLLNGAVFGVSWRYLWGYVAWLLLASVIACAAIWATLLLVRWLGPRRARTWSQVAAAALGAAVYLAVQLRQLLPREQQADAFATATNAFAHPFISALARAGRGELFPLLGLLLAAAVSAGLTLRLLARLFLSGAQEAAAVAPPARRPRRHTWRAGLVRATFWKDLRLIARDPLLLMRVLPPLLYLLPALFVAGRKHHEGLVAGLAPFAVLASLFVSSQLALIATAGEEGWDLIRMSDVSTIRLRVAKVAASMALPLGFCVLIAAAITVLGRPGLALLTLAVCVVSTSAACWAEVAVIRPTPRHDLIQKRGRIGGLSATRIVLGVVFLAGGTAAVALAARHLWAFSAFACGVVGLTSLACFVFVNPRDPESW